MGILRLIARILMFPIMLIITIAKCIVSFGVKLSMIVGSWFLIFIGLCATYSLVCCRWSDLFVLLVIGVSALVILFFGVVIEDKLATTMEKMREI